MGKPEEVKEPVQLEFFRNAYSEIELRETKRSLQTIVRECIRLGLHETVVCHIVKLMESKSGVIEEAIAELDEVKED